jgi:hypothetical protein
MHKSNKSSIRSSDIHYIHDYIMCFMFCCLIIILCNIIMIIILINFWLSLIFIIIYFIFIHTSAFYVKNRERRKSQPVRSVQLKEKTKTFRSAVGLFGRLLLLVYWYTTTNLLPPDNI